MRPRLTRIAGAGLVILPGTKNTRADLRWLRSKGIDAAVCRARDAGAAVIGICGGFQMLGRSISDPLGSEGPPGDEPGLGLLPVETVFAGEKATRQVSAGVTAGHGILAGLRDTPLTGYEIHMGDTPAPAEAAFAIGPARTPDGALSDDGRVLGTYLHGLFANDAFRRGLLANLAPAGNPAPSFLAWDPDAHIARLAREASRYLDIARIRALAGV